MAGGRRFGKFGFDDYYYEHPFSATISVSSGQLSDATPKLRDPEETVNDLPAPGEGYSYVIDEIHISTDQDLTDFHIANGSGTVYGPHTIPSLFGVIVFGPPGVIVGDNKVPKITGQAAVAWTGRIDIRGKVVPI